MDHVQDILDVEHYIKDNIIEACKELRDQNMSGELKADGIIKSARAKIHWLNARSQVVEQLIHNEAIRIVANSK